MLNPADTLCDLISIPSVNPMGRSVEGSEFLETRVTDYLQAQFEQMGLAWQRQTVEPGRDNIVARLDGDPPLENGGRLLLLEVHQDTVPVDGMTIEPFCPGVREGRIYGRGACDVKGGMSAMLCGLARLAQERPAGRPTIVLACTVNEEHGFSGAKSLVELWSPGRDSLISRAPDAAVVAEPTNLDVVVAHKGVLRWKCSTTGRAVHSSQPHLGVNAIYRMSYIIQEFERYQAQIASQAVPHPRCGRPSVCVSTIEGGISVNTVPDRATIQIDRRLLPGEDPDSVYQAMLAYIDEHAADTAGSIQHEPPFIVSKPLSDTENARVAEQLAEMVRPIHPGCQLVGVPFGTDAAEFAGAGVPTVVFGPGSIDQAHTADEWIDTGQLDTACEIIYRCGRFGL